MPETGTVNWYGKDVSLAVNTKSRVLLMKLALTGEGLAKMNIRENDQIDTGFMMNAVTVVDSSGALRHIESGDFASGRTGETVHREAVPLPGADEDSLGIGCAAEYAIHQEMKHSFLYRALEQLKAQFEDVAGDITVTETPVETEQ